MRPVREITAEEENFRTEPLFRPTDPEYSPELNIAHVIRRDPVAPEPVGTIILMAFRVTGYDKDCDGSLMARLENINKDSEASGWTTDSHGLHPDGDLVVTQSELTAMFEPTTPKGGDDDG